MTVAEKRGRRCTKWSCTKWRCRKRRCSEPTNATRRWPEQHGGSDGGGARCRERYKSDEMKVQRITRGDATVAGATWWQHGVVVEKTWWPERGCRE
ncbi:hypothetical protein DEO72_LG11g726 [Vigna unguiculata]|nr:hypothetical protein DEO72_LG11g724 [Vigna unguiculata]QCE13730.1 hypothetical protein DEO72_LG11g726 [Vigna unguiculata]